MFNILSSSSYFKDTLSHLEVWRDKSEDYCSSTNMRIWEGKVFCLFNCPLYFVPIFYSSKTG